MPHLTRGLATLVAGSLTAAGLAAAATAPAQADTEPLPVLRWEISQQFDDHLSTHVLGDGALESEAGVIKFPAGVTSYDAGDATTSVAYDGSVSGSFAVGPMTYYTVTLADPVVTVDGSGAGEVTAVVSASNAAAMGNPADSTSPTRVVVTTFEGGTWTPGADLDTLSATPDWAGVLAPNSPEATALGIAADKPVEGKAFNPAFLGGITSGVRAHFYGSGSGSDPKKAPASFTAEVPRPAVQVTTTGASYANGLDLTVSGEHFRGVTQPGDDGVYVGLAESGALPDTSSMNLDLFAAAQWVQASVITDGSFVTTLNAPTERLDPSLDYSVYTWQAHSHSTTSQDTETPVSIDWSALEQKRVRSTVSGAWVRKPTTKVGGRLAVKVAGASGRPTGKVVVKLVRNGAVKRTFTRTLQQGGASVALPRLVAGAWKVQLRYAGSATYLASTKVLSLRVTR